MTNPLKNKPTVSAYSYGLRLLSVHGYSEAALIGKLHRAHYVTAEIQSAVEKLKSYGFINDLDLAMSYFRSYFSSGKTGFYLIRAKLKQKGFSTEIIAECLRTYDNDRAFDQAVKLAQTHFSNLQSQEKPRIARYLAARGFSTEIIQSALQKLLFE
jgi:regulatory protein